jgi:hypothetical protein
MARVSGRVGAALRCAHHGHEAEDSADATQRSAEVFLEVLRLGAKMVEAGVRDG